MKPLPADGVRVHAGRRSGSAVPVSAWSGLCAVLARPSFEEYLFYFAFALCLFTTLVVRTTYPQVLFLGRDAFEPLGYSLSALLLLAKLLIEREASWRYCAALGLVAVGIASFAVAGVWRFSVLFLFVAAGRGVSLRRLAGIALFAHALVALVTVPLAAAGKLYSFTVWREVGGTWQPRSSYGYSHPNMLGQVFLTIALSYAVLRFPRLRVADVLVYGACGLLAGALVWSRTATACIVLVACFALAAPRLVRSNALQKRFAALALAVFVAVALLSYAFMVAYNPELSWMRSIDHALSTRFSLAHRFWEVFPPTAFGRSLMAVKLDGFLQESPDNVYAYVLLKQGIVPTLVLAVLVLSVYVAAWRAGSWNACIMGLFVFALGGVMEMYAINFTLDYFLIGGAQLLYAPFASDCGAPHG